MDDMQTMQIDSSSEIAKLLVPYLLKIDVKDPLRPRRAEAPGGLGLQPGLRLRGGRLLQRRLAQHPQARLRQQAAQGAAPRGPVPARPPRRPVRPGRRPRRQGAPCASAASAPPTRPSPTAATAGSRSSASILQDRTTPGGRPTGTAHASRGDRNRDQLLAQAMKDARCELTAKLGKDIDTWSWGRLHKLKLKNQTLGTDGPGFVKWLLNRGPWNLGGGEAAVNATGWNAAGGYDVVWVPSMRMVVNLADFDKSRWINLTGASGHAYNAHYSDQTAKWAKGELLPWAFTPQEGRRRRTDDTLALMPYRCSGRRVATRPHDRRPGGRDLRPRPRRRQLVRARSRAGGKRCTAAGVTARVHRPVVRLGRAPRPTTSFAYSSTTSAGRAPARSSRASTRSYEPPPRPSRMPARRPPRAPAAAPRPPRSPRRVPAAPRPAPAAPAGPRPGPPAPRSRPSPGRCPAAGRAAAPGRRAPRSASSSAAGARLACPPTTYAATVRRRGELGQSPGPRSARARARPSATSPAVNPALTSRRRSARPPS